MISFRSATTRTGFDLHPNQCRVADVHVRTRDDVSGDLRVKTFALLAEGRMSPALSVELDRLRQQHELSRHAWVTIWGLRSVHQFLRLPPTAAADLEALSLQEAQHELSALEDEAGPVSVSRMLGPDVKVGTHRRREVSLTAVPEAEIARQIQPLIDAGFDVRGVCTPAMALTAVARLYGRTTPGTTAAYVALESDAMCVAIVRDGVLLFSRETPWAFVDSAAASGDRLADELRRSFLFFRQSFRAAVERIVLCGGIANLRALTSSTGATLDLPVETLDSLSAIDAEAIPEPADMFRASVAALWPAIAVASGGDDQPNLLPAATRAQRKTRVKIVVAAVVVGGALTAIAWYLMSSPARDSHAAELGRLERQVARLEQEVQRASVPPTETESTASGQAAPRSSAQVSIEPELVLGSILYSPQRRLAIVNGRIVGVGDRIGSATVVGIGPREVIVQSADGTKRTLELRRK